MRVPHIIYALSMVVAQGTNVALLTGEDCIAVMRYLNPVPCMGFSSAMRLASARKVLELCQLGECS